MTYGRFPHPPAAPNNEAFPIAYRAKLLTETSICLFDTGLAGWGYPEQANPMPAAYHLKNYVRDGADAIVGANPVPFAAPSLAFDNVNETIVLPAAAKLPANTQEFFWIMWGTVYTSGYPIGGSGNGICNIVGIQDGGFIQHAFIAYYNKATGALSTFQAGINNQGPDVTAFIPTDNLRHQYAARWRVTSSTTATLDFYVDGALVASFPTLTDTGALSQAGTAAPAICYRSHSGGTGDAAHFKIDRYMLDVGAGIADDLIAADFARYAGR